MLKKIRLKNEDKINCLLFLTFVFGLLSVYFNYLYHVGEMEDGLRMIFLVGDVTFVSAFILLNKSKLDDSYRKSVRRQIVGVCCIGLLSSIAVIRESGALIADRVIYYLLFAGSVALISLLVVMWDLAKKDGAIRSRIVAIRENKHILIMLIILLAMTYHRKTYFLWDCHNMFSHMDNIDDIYSLWDINDWIFFGHISYSYVIGAIIHKFIYGTALLGQIMYAKLLFLIGAFGFWKLINYMYKGRSVVEYLAVTAAYACSPFMLGMVGYSYNDYATWCVLPIMLYFLWANQDIYAFLAGMYFVFCKETDVVVYAFIILGMQLVDIVSKRKLFYNYKRYLVLYVPCFIWLFSYETIGHWTGGGEMVFNKGYALGKLKSFFFVNFNWAVLALAIVALVSCAVVKEYRNYMKYFFPVSFSSIIYLVISVIINTGVLHPRYIDALYASIYIMASFVPMILLKKKMIKNVVLTGSIAVLFISCFFTVDPISRICFSNINVGKRSVICTAEPMSDGFVYNDQHQNYGYVMDMALDGVCDADNVIFMPVYNNDSWHFDSMGHYRTLSEGENEIVVSENWNDKLKTRMVDDDYEGNISFDVHNITDEYCFELHEGQRGIYYYTEYVGLDIANKIEKSMQIISKDSFEKGGWIVYRLIFE
ncbi:MAG: hypothetical protein J5802_14905 [Butyrivibrio sp.]|nr:hypothetical protein [Butyrivibrio sp.]